MNIIFGLKSNPGNAPQNLHKINIKNLKKFSATMACEITSFSKSGTAIIVNVSDQKDYIRGSNHHDKHNKG